ncbi:gamma-glutamyltransferase [Amycolatopsis acidiphila]|uniref:Glutathione hydrolase proenzyme n=1 Tax=Amycolatopsis acidiphila TaxID=715473 RepID=A0A557ZXW0_9PSEU|nr:gamma-glutamyltransferase [Amycolatopsis acidiphila]TVT16841.1 gamma-glutamyltransferase [Amycolatopsis acidiphila]UIJ63045.1 gamma-glutamyltransferase [Amycolatopsis acidiphila]GHG65822.1 gamma-glutamyltranspeptidase [Amycolatopsis acidiphila]
MDGSRHGVVVSPEPRAAEIGADVLRRGGNAFDAAVATAFAQTVFSPFMCGLGGWGLATTYHAKTRTSKHFGFSARVGSRMFPEMWAEDIKGYTDMWHVALVEGHKNLMGYTAIMTPGTVAGLGELHRTYGSLPWADLIEPSVEASDQGYPISEQVAGVSRSFVFPGMPPVEEHYCWSDAAKELWIRPDGTLKQAGEPFRNPDHAKTLRQLADRGAEDFYTGDLADLIVRDFELNGAFVTAEDLANYEVDIEQPLTGGYRGFQVESASLPNGGLLILHILKVLERFDLAKLEHNGPEHAFLVGAALAWAGVIRFRYLADPKYQEVPLEWLLSDAYTDEIAGHLRRGELPDLKVLHEPGGTTHLSVADDEGNCVSLTQTLSIPSGVVIPGTGFTWNGCTCLMDPEPGRVNSLVPGRSRANAAAPTILFKDGKPAMVVGSPGGYSIPSAVTQALSNVIDFGMSPSEAVAAPRLHSEGRPVFAEGRISQRTIRALQDRGMPIVQKPANYLASFGRVQLITLAGEGGFAAAADPRNDGGIACYA